MNLSSIKQSIENMDYAWNKPQSYLAFVPVLSLIIQKIQFDKLLPLENGIRPLNSTDRAAYDIKQAKFLSVGKWHGRAAMVTAAACTLAVKAFALPIFSLIGLMAVCDGLYAASKMTFTHVTIREFYPDGKEKKSITESAISHLFFSI